jgi:hypothetical protein
MRGIDWALDGSAEDWMLFEAADVARSEAEDDESFERWLASLPADGVEHILSGLLNEPGHVAFGRVA